MRPPGAEPLEDVEEAVEEALAAPIGCARLGDRVKATDTVCVILSDKARSYPRNLLLGALLAEIPHVPHENLTLLVANGNHTPSTAAEIELDLERFGHLKFASHDSRDPGQLEYLGKTPSRFWRFFPRALLREMRCALVEAIPNLAGVLMGIATLSRRRLRAHIGLGPPGRILLALKASLGTSVWLNRNVVESDWVVSLGQIKPHYFAGFSGGVKNIMPGVAGLGSIATNHFMKTDRSARVGVVENNLVRDDLEAAVAMLGDRVFIVNLVTDQSKRPVAVVAGDPVAAQRAGAERARRAATVEAGEPADVVVVSSGLPLGLNLYQLLKAVVPAAPLVKPGGSIVLAGACVEGVGPPFIVNEVIWKMGITSYLPRRVQLLLVSSMDAGEAARAPFAVPFGSVREALAAARSRSPGRRTTLAVLPSGDMVLPVGMGS